MPHIAAGNTITIEREPYLLKEIEYDIRSNGQEDEFVQTITVSEM
jgi:hypothetical protein